MPTRPLRGRRLSLATTTECWRLGEKSGGQGQAQEWTSRRRLREEGSLTSEGEVGGDGGRDDAEGGAMGGGKECSICLDTVVAGGERSMMRLQCGHELHLDKGRWVH